MSKLTNSRKGMQKKHAYANTIGAGGGTLLLLMAENMPDTYWFKTYVVMATPTISVGFSNFTDWLVNGCKALFNILQVVHAEKEIAKAIRLLKKNPNASEEAILQLELAAVEATLKNAKRIIDKLDNLRR